MWKAYIKQPATKNSDATTRVTVTYSNGVDTDIVIPHNANTKEILDGLITSELKALNAITIQPSDVPFGDSEYIPTITVTP